MGEPEDVFQAMNQAAFYIRNIVSFCKRIIVYEGLPQPDQLTLLKSLFPKLLFVRIAYLFQPANQGWNWLAVSLYSVIQ